MPELNDKIDHIVVLMLENQSFDCLIGKFKPVAANFDGLTGNEFNDHTASDHSTTRTGGTRVLRYGWFITAISTLLGAPSGSMRCRS